MSTNVLTNTLAGAPDVRTRWMLHLALAGALLALLIGVFFADIASAVSVWWIYPAYSHCFLVIPISAWLIWERRDQIMLERPAVAPIALLAAAIPIMIWLVGYYAMTN